jgi:hypothetical protein
MTSILRRHPLRHRCVAPGCVLLLAALSLAGMARDGRADVLHVYDEQLLAGFEDWSWATHDLAASDVVHAGTHSISMRVKNWEGVYLHRAEMMSLAALDTLDLWIYGAASGGQQVRVWLDRSGTWLGSAPLQSFVAGGTIPGGAWAHAIVPLAALAAPQTTYDGIVFQADVATDQGTIHLDDLRLAGGSGPAPVETLLVSVDPRLDRHAVSPLVYGVNFGSSVEFGDLPYPARRWGGNSTTRYSWQNDTHNTGSDWFFMNIASSLADPTTLPEGSEADLFVAETRAAGAQTVLTVPTIGWTPKDRVKRWGFSVAKYGAQAQTECTATGGASWCTADAGNGVRASNGQSITGNDPLDTSVPVGPSFATGWLGHLTARFGRADAAGVRYYALDNEPMLWNSTHRDVHPTAVTYDELWQRTLDYSGAIKTADPAAQVLGPVVWGWCAYFHSAADGCSAGADQAAHGGTPLLEWYLQQVHARQQATGVRPVDLLDIHYYPQDGSALNEDESATTAARRLRELKSLYNSTYVDESWIGQPVRLIPRMKQIIAARCPGVGLAITEYNFGGDTGISSALAQAEALAIFGREGVGLATRWVAPQHGTRCQDAFRLYLDYDGTGGAVTGQSVRAVSGNVDRVGAYAIEDPAGRLFVLLFNKDAAEARARVTLADGVGGPVSLYRFTAASGLASAGTLDGSGARLDLTLPARSATLAVVARPGATAAPEPLADASASLQLSIRPNPLRGSATLAFVLPRPGRVTLTIYDVAGRRLRTLVDAALPAGPQGIVWDGTDAEGRPLASGAYRCRLSTAGRVETRCVIRLR